jgi:anti-sigma B factor antagonist
VAGADLPQIEGFAADVVEAAGDKAAIKVSGEVDLYTAPVLKSRLFSLVADGALYLTVDLADVTFLDSTGLGVIVSTLKRVREGGGNLQIQSPSAPAFKVLEITGLTKLIEIV